MLYPNPLYLIKTLTNIMKRILLFLLLCSLSRVILAEGFWMGMLGDDGVISPMALYDGKEWSQPWPYSGIPTKYWYRVEDIFGDLSFIGEEDLFNRKQIPRNKYNASLENIPKPWLGESNTDIKKWYLYGKNEEDFQFNVSNMKLYTAKCSTSIGLLSNYKNEEKDKVPLVVPDPRKDIGFIYTKPVNIVPIEKNNEQDNKKVISFLTERFKNEEAKMLKKQLDERKKLEMTDYLVSSSIHHEVEKSDIEINKIYSSDFTSSGWKIYYVAMSRRYGSSLRENSKSCDTIKYIQTWMKVKNNTIEIISENKIYSDCDMKGSEFFDPSFILSLNDKHYIISEKSGWDTMWYSIHELKNNNMKQVLDIEDCYSVHG